MNPVQALSAGSGPPAAGSKRKAEPLYEGCRVLEDREACSVLRTTSKRFGADVAHRFMNAREKLRRDFGASIDVVEPLSGGALSVAARYEFLTTDKSIDDELAFMAERAGFALTLRSVPLTCLPAEERFERVERSYPAPVGTTKDEKGREVTLYGLKTFVSFEERMERVYLLAETRYRSAELHRAADSAESFLALLTKLRPRMAEDLPNNVYLLESARAKALPAPGTCLPDAPAVAAQVS